ncbi:hypothetical protein UFOVP71_306 [uncultured Caudovirales phage]|uniref:Uncharacterized protein n=1 Tax=uncultured Caudovirales phage TaxID=2100421 RepID=A0A6J5TA06_9CAUD|nr:hypothetical protein UFOVP71_306 [uncultured Caudovirales phage]
MTMHLEGPWLSTTGKQKTKRKWASSEQKRKAEQLAQEWTNKQAEWAKFKSFSGKKVTATNLNTLPKLAPPPGREYGPRHPSRDTGGNATLKAPNVYTGTKVKGIATMHKSNAVPVFSDEEAIDISKMRR